MPYSEKICWTLEVSCIASFLFISFRWTKKQRILVSAFGFSCWEGIWLEYNRGGYKQQCTPLHTQPQLVFLQKIHFSITKCVHYSPLPWCSNRIKNSCALSRLEIFQGKVSFLVHLKISVASNYSCRDGVGGRWYFFVWWLFVYNYFFSVKLKQ